MRSFIPFSQSPEARAARLTAIHDYLAASGFPALSEEQRLLLESPVSPSEIKETMSSRRSGKSPGPDGYTKAYYVTFLPLLIGPMCKYFNSLTEGVQMPFEALLTHIMVLPKEGKDPTLVQHYRPISLLNVDVKILAMVLANRLKHLMPLFGHPHQTGFITGYEARDNSLRAVRLILWACTNTSISSYIVLSTDAEKTFDQVSWS